MVVLYSGLDCTAVVLSPVSAPMLYFSSKSEPIVLISFLLFCLIKTLSGIEAKFLHLVAGIPSLAYLDCLE